MKSQRAQFEAVDGSELRISLSRGKQNLKTMVRHRDAQEERVHIGLKNWFELDQESQAQSSFDELVADAISRGWTPVKSERKRKYEFSSIPEAPKLKLESESDVVEQLQSTLKSVKKAAKR